MAKKEPIPPTMSCLDRDCCGNHYNYCAEKNHPIHNLEYQAYDRCTCHIDQRTCTCGADTPYPEVLEWCDCDEKDKLKKRFPTAFGQRPRRPPPGIPTPEIQLCSFIETTTAPEEFHRWPDQYNLH
jgi:hypothetical protein